MDTETGPTWPHKSQQYDMNGKIMLGAVISLSVVIILVLILHIYARCTMTRRHGGGAATVHHLPLQHRHVDIHHQSNNAGLDPEVIASLPLFVVVKDQGGGGDCAVCLSDLEEGEEARRLPNCKHRFHVECIDRWLSNQSNCPICRTEVTPWAVAVDEVATVVPPAEEEGCSDSVQGSSIKELNGSSSSSRLSSFRRIISGDWSSRRIQQIGVHDVVQDLERQSS